MASCKEETGRALKRRGQETGAGAALASALHSGNGLLGNEESDRHGCSREAEAGRWPIQASLGYIPLKKKEGKNKGVEGKGKERAYLLRRETLLFYI